MHHVLFPLNSVPFTEAPTHHCYIGIAGNDVFGEKYPYCSPHVASPPLQLQTWKINRWESSPFSHAAVAAAWCRLPILFPKALLVDLAIPTPNANGGFQQ
jgi:hypothetical protein